jgi:amidase
MGEPFDPSNPFFSSAVGAGAAIRRSEISSAELTRLTLERIDRENPSLNAIVNVLREQAMEQARAADEALAQGKHTGPLQGVPITIKDGLEIAGVPTTAGVPAWKDYKPAEDGVIVRRLRKAGAVILGNTNVPFMLADWQSYNDIYGTTTNPWDALMTAGGSSGGSAAALAKGLGHLSIGSDLAGSIRIPAHFCGVYGHKPSLNVIPLRGRVPPPPGMPLGPAPDLPVAGPMARSALDLQAAMETLGGPDDDERVAYSWRLPLVRHLRLPEYRIGFVLDDPGCRVSSDVKAALEACVQALAKKGVKLKEGWPPGVSPAGQYETYRYLLSAFFASGMKDDEIESVRARAADPAGGMRAVAARAWIEPHKHFQAASRDRMSARAAFPHDHSRPVDKRVIATPEGAREYMDLPFWPSFATLTGLPSTTAPIGFTRSSLPVGIQIVGPYLEDATPIDIAAKMADIIGGFRPPP